MLCTLYMIYTLFTPHNTWINPWLNVMMPGKQSAMCRPAQPLECIVSTRSGAISLSSEMGSLKGKEMAVSTSQTYATCQAVQIRHPVSKIMTQPSHERAVKALLASWLQRSANHLTGTHTSRSVGCIASSGTAPEGEHHFYH